MLTKSGISIITSGMAGNLKVGNAPSNMKNEPEDYVWLKAPCGKWICYNNATQDPDNFTIGSGESPFAYSANHRVLTDNTYLLKRNDDLDDTLGSYNTSGFCQFTLLLGDGTTQPTVDDYKLEHCVTAYTRKQESMYFDAKNLQCQVSIIIEPTEQITIREIGCYKRCYTGTSTTSSSINFNTNCLSLIDRKVLAEPLIIEEGDITTITYVIDFRNLNDGIM